ncbi:MAG: nitroreductase [Ruminococcus sp.]|jgi:nitroreductase|nr:nitroreductase [Ruminococcus sp.]
MNAVIENILTRRSFRAYKDTPVSYDDLQIILECALHAPSAMNKQTWHFTALTDKDEIAALAKAVGNTLRRDDYDFYKPAALIITSNDPECVYGKEDNACAMENIMLAAHALGMGSVWINQLNGFSETPGIKEALESLDLPEGYVVYGCAAIGYPESAELAEKQVLGSYDIK